MVNTDFYFDHGGILVNQSGGDKREIMNGRCKDAINYSSVKKIDGGIQAIHAGMAFA